MIFQISDIKCCIVEIYSLQLLGRAMQTWITSTVLCPLGISFTSPRTDLTRHPGSFEVLVQKDRNECRSTSYSTCGRPRVFPFSLTTTVAPHHLLVSTRRDRVDLFIYFSPSPLQEVFSGLTSLRVFPVNPVSIYPPARRELVSARCRESFLAESVSRFRSLSGCANSYLILLNLNFVQNWSGDSQD